MWRHNLKLNLRNFKNNKSTFLINLTGLSTGLACVILIFLWVKDEVSYDKFHEQDAQLYQVMENMRSDDAIFTIDQTPGLMAAAAVEDLPEVEKSVAVTGQNAFNAFLSTEKENIYAKGSYVGSQFFDVFSFKILQGGEKELFQQLNSAVLTEEMAMKLFGTTQNIIGKTIQWTRGDKEMELSVSGIYETPPTNSSLRFDFVMPMARYLSNNPDDFDWGNRILNTFLVVKEGTNLDQLNTKLSNLLNRKEEIADAELFVQKYSDKYLFGEYENGKQSGGRITYVRLFSVIIVFILLIACINFMNLSTAQASKRLKEIGVKKAIGGSRQSLVFQYLGESMLLSIFGLLVALVLVQLLLPQFNELTGKQLALIFNPNLIIALVGVCLLTGLLSGSYPALFLSGFSPIAILKGQINRSVGEAWIRKGLVVFQFSISIILIIAVLIVYRQISFVQNKHLGYDKEQMLYFKPEGKISKNVETVLTEIRKITGVQNAASVSRKMIGPGQKTPAIAWPGKTKDILFDAVFVNYGLIETMELEMAAGRPYDKQFGAEIKNIILNEAAIKAMNLENPIGKKIQLWEAENYLTIIGVVKDFHFESLHKKVTPMFMELDPDDAEYILTKIEKGKEQEVIADLKSFHDTYNPEYAFNYGFMDKAYEAQYQSEMRVGTLAKYFAGLAILISCLGLFGLAAFTAERRRKEISIRKILGASPLSIVQLLSKDFTLMVLVAMAIAFPISYWVGQEWLSGFAFRIELTPWFFLGAGLSALLIAWVTVGFQTIKASLMNPTMGLKSE